MPRQQPLIASDPLTEAESILKEHFYVGRPTPPSAKPAKPAKPKPTHYKIVCISLYVEDIRRLEGLVSALKRRGHTKANKSAVIRFALDSVDIDKMPKGY
jgi:hypothetical protein